jgi:hypothetical protein
MSRALLSTSKRAHRTNLQAFSWELNTVATSKKTSWLKMGRIQSLPHKMLSGDKTLSGGLGSPGDTPDHRRKYL